MEAREAARMGQRVEVGGLSGSTFTREIDECAGHPRQLRIPEPDPTSLESRRAGHAHREADLARHQPEPRPGDEHRRVRTASRPRQPRNGDDLRGTRPPLQRREQRGGGRALDPARRRGSHGEAPVPPHRRSHQVRDLPPLRRRLRHRRHADRGGGNPPAARRRARQGGVHASLRAGDQRRDVRDLQGGPPAQGRRRGSRQHRRGAGTLHPRERRVPVARVRLHALQSSLREELEDRPRTHGRQEGDARPAVRH